MKKHIERALLLVGLTLLTAANSFGAASISGVIELNRQLDYTRGPDPTEAYLEAADGPFTINTLTVSSSVNGFGGGTIYYPTNTEGTMAAISVAPGFTAPQSRIAWWGPRIASHGFIVITIDTNSKFDFPSSRARQLGRALDYVIDLSGNSGSAISGMVDPARVGAMGWSMGGGGTLKLAGDEPDMMAAIPLAPWYFGANNFDDIQTPTMILGCESDGTAPVGSHSIPFYNDIPDSTEKAYLEINNGNHSCANGGGANDGLLGRYGISWMKRFLDLDTRYDQFLCGPDHVSDAAISDYRDNCAYL